MWRSREVRDLRTSLPLYLLTRPFCLATASASTYNPPAMFAIVDIAGTQEKVTLGQKLHVPLHDAEVGKKIVFENVLLTADGDSVSVGAPLVPGAAVEAKILSHGKEDKIRVVKTMRRKRYKRTKGHRQNYTEVEVTGIKA